MNESGLTREEIERKSHKSSAERPSRFYYFPLSVNLTSHVLLPLAIMEA